jgi:hypothetical protein
MLKILLLAPLIWIAFYGGLALVAVLVGTVWRRLRRSVDRTLNPTAVYRLRARMKRLARPTLLLIPAKAPGFSKIGGLPELPEGVAWPRDEDGPAAFVAQLDLAAFSRLDGFDWLPRTGRIYLFFEDQRRSR